MEGSLVAYSIRTHEQAPPVLLPKPERSASASGTASATSLGTSFSVGSSDSCDFTIGEPGWRERHLEFTWHQRHASWVLENVSDSPVYADGRVLEPRAQLPLLMWESTIEGPGIRLQFQRRPEPARFHGQPVLEVPLTAAGLMIGRGDRNKDGSATPRLALDPDLLAISSGQAEIRPLGEDFVLVNSNTNPRGRTIVNGDQNFDEKKLVLGDCIQIPNCDQYTFKYTGTSLKCLPPAGSLEAAGLTVDVKAGRILHQVDLRLGRGEFMGIIGGSGQGKSTLMHSLCGIVPATSGSVAADGLMLRSPADVARANIGYVPQDDIVHAELLVEDALYFAARLRLRATRHQILDAIEATMETLRLTEHRKKKISRLSGGQRKRVSIASELLASPDYLFLDEPTSGLDPQTERALMGELSLLARRKRIGVVSTTHVLQNCHVMTQLAFISRGRLIFFGSPVDAVRFFVYGRHPLEEQPGEEEEVFRPSGSVPSIGDGDASPEFSESDLLTKIANIYDIAQDTTKPVPLQDRVATAWEKRYRASAAEAMVPRLAASPTVAPPPPKVSAPLALGMLLARQWKLLTSARLNYLFLVLQATVIGLLIAWVSDNIVLQLFLALIATLWFGCSNGAQQIVAELQIFRRERLAGLGIHTYLCSKFLFLTAITGLQGMLLFALVTVGALLFHGSSGPDPEREEDARRMREPLPPGESRPLPMPDRETRQFRMDFFDKTWETLARVDHPSASVDNFEIVGMDPAEAARAGGQVIEMNPTGLQPSDFSYRLMEKLAGFFHLRENVLDSLAIKKVTLKPGETPESVAWRNVHLSWVGFFATAIGLRLLALFAAAVVGVGLGMAVSSLVDTPTQAVMWVPLILIPQILFGSFVVIVPEMDDAVLAFSSCLPSFNLQRTMDVALIYGRAVPRVTNKTKIPAFLSNPPNTTETVTWGHGQQTLYDRVSEVNKSWQNLAVDRKTLGAREKALNLVTKQGFPPESAVEVYPDSIESRPDVRASGQPLQKGEHFVDLGPAHRSLLALAAWAAACYGVAAFSLYRRQTGR